MLGILQDRGELQRQLDLEYSTNQKLLEKEFLGKKISILQDGLRGKESYTGICKEITSDGIYTEILAQYKYELHYIRHKYVISILRYNEQSHPIY